MGNVGQFDLDVLGAIHWRPKVEILDIKGTELGPWTRENTIDDKFYKFEGGCGGGNFPWEDNVIPCNGNPGTILILLLGAYFTYYPGETNLLPSIMGDIT